MPARSLRLVILPISPWSERAKWALDHHRLVYRQTVHVPFLGERRLRRLVGPAQPRATVPVLIADERVLADSFTIAEYADAVGTGEPLLPAALKAEIRAATDRADQLMGIGRALVTGGMLASGEALDEALPPAMPRWIRRLLRPVTRYSTAWFGRKYKLQLQDLSAHIPPIRAALLDLRTRLNGRDYLLSCFSYADIATATALQGIDPVEDCYVPLGPATRAVWTVPELAAEFADLLSWRDRLYEEHRGLRLR